MCGYIRRVTDNPQVGQLLKQIGLGGLAQPMAEHSTDELEHYYPTFGGNPGRQIRSLIIQNEGKPQLVDATWWFDCEPDGDDLKVGRRTTFNARNLDSPFWKGALRHHRGIVVATGIGETKVIDGRKRHFLMEGAQPFLLGALYRPFPNRRYSCSVITRDAHLKFEPYHDKAFPLFLPATEHFVRLWLDGEVTQAEEFDELLERPKLHARLQVEEVKTFKRGEVTSDAVVLEADEI